MPKYVPPFDRDHFERLYKSDLSLDEIATRLGCSRALVKKRLREFGIPRTKQRRPVDTAAITAAHKAGESVNAIAARLGYSRSVIVRRLHEAGVRQRGQSDAMFIRMAQIPPEERKRLIDAAHKTLREAPRRPFKHRGTTTARHEDMVCKALAEAGLDPIPQQPVGTYRLDVGCWPVAVEIHSTAGYPHRVPKLTRRTEYLLDRGWSVLYVGGFRCEINPEHVVAYVQAARLNPPVPPEYRVIRGSGEAIAVGKMDGGQLTVETTAENSTKPDKRDAGLP